MLQGIVKFLAANQVNAETLAGPGGAGGVTPEDELEKALKALEAEDKAKADADGRDAPDLETGPLA